MTRSDFEKSSITLPGGVAMGTGVMIGAGIALDAVVLVAFAAMKWQSDPLIVLVGIVGMAMVFLFVGVFLARNPVREGAHDHH